MQAIESFFEPDGDSFVATELTRGPWSPLYQHGGPPAALMARAIERENADADPPLRVARMTVEFLRPVPIGRLEVSCTVERAGRRVRHLEASVSVAGELVCRATALCMRQTRLDFDRVPGGAPKPPEQSKPFHFPFFRDSVGYHKAMEVRFAAGEFGTGAATAWMRMRVPLVPGELPSPLCRVMAAADSGNGVSVVLDVTHYTFVNPDLTVYLHRMPEGEWVCLDATTTPQPEGVGLAHSGLFDVAGPIGHSLQSLLVEAR